MSCNKDLYLEWVPSAYNDRAVKAGEGNPPALPNPQRLLYVHPKPDKKPRYRPSKQR